MDLSQYLQLRENSSFCLFALLLIKNWFKRDEPFFLKIRAFSWVLGRNYTTYTHRFMTLKRKIE